MERICKKGHIAESGKNCKICMKEWRKEYNEKNKENIKEYRKNNKENESKNKKEYYKNNKEIIDNKNKKYREDEADDTRRNRKLKWKYGITLEEYNSTLEEQNFCCAICHKHLSEFKRNLAVDHCHKTNKIRGLLCNSCNLVIGYADDNLDILKEAINYIKKWK